MLKIILKVFWLVWGDLVIGVNKAVIYSCIGCVLYNFTKYYGKLSKWKGEIIIKFKKKEKVV